MSNDFFDDARSPGTRLRELMDAGCTAAPGAFNALCARAVAKAGFQACYVSGAATSVSAGVPDVGLLTLEHFCRVIREVADASGLPVLADAISDPDKEPAFRTGPYGTLASTVVRTTNPAGQTGQLCQNAD